MSSDNHHAISEIIYVISDNQHAITEIIYVVSDNQYAISEIIYVISDNQHAIIEIHAAIKEINDGGKSMGREKSPARTLRLQVPHSNSRSVSDT
jgi:hypothetical protein